MQLMMAGRLDFNLGGGRAIEFVQQNLPFVAIAAMFQKDPSVLIAHPGQGNDSFAALKGKPILIGADTRSGWWRFLAAKYGYTDAQIRPYTFNLQPFLADRTAIQQGYLGSEPFAIEQASALQAGGAAGRRCRLCRLRQHRHHQHKLIKRKARPRAALHRCLDRGLVFLPLRRPGARPTRLIKQDNPEMTDALLHYGRDVMKDTRHRQFRRRVETRHRRDDRCALGRVLSFHVRCRRVPQRPRRHEGLYAAVRRQARRHDLKK